MRAIDLNNEHLTEFAKRKTGTLIDACSSVFGLTLYNSNLPTVFFNDRGKLYSSRMVNERREVTSKDFLS